MILLPLSLLGDPKRYATGGNLGHRPLPAVHDLTRDGRWSTYDVSVLKKMGGGVHTERTPSKTATITNKTRPAGSFFPPAWQAVRLAGPVFYVYVFSLGVSERNNVLVSILRKTGQGAKRLEAALLETPLVD